ncbi:MAG: hypothetical protein ABI806_06725 [Candidatus Solibacter sp.]
MKANNAGNVDHRIDEQSFRSAFRHFQNIEAVPLLQRLEREVHPPAILKALPGPPAFPAPQTAEELHNAPSGPEPVNGNIVAFQCGERTLFFKAGQDMHFVAESCQGTSLVPSVRAYSAEAGLWWVLEG